jgi:hypothetical protein
MKQLLSLFLFLLPCLALAQYPTNGNQKITLGEQTSADGLIYRGVLADTGIITPSSDTSAYIILDTVNNRFYNYNRATNVWSMAGVGSISSGLTGVLPVANGGTNRTTMPNGYVLHGDGTSVDTSIGLFYDRTNNALGIGTTIPNSFAKLTVLGGSAHYDRNVSGGVSQLLMSMGASSGGNFGQLSNIGTRWSLGYGGNTTTTGTEVLTWNSSGNVGIGTPSPGSRLVVKGSTDVSPESALNVTNSSNNSLLFVRNDGNVGIGTASPSYRLSIQGSAGIEQSEEYFYFNSSYAVGSNASAKIRAVGAGGGSGYGGDFRVSTRATNNAWNEDAFIVNSLGNVGIGTTSPAEKLSVSGAIISTGGITGHGANRTTISQEGANGAYWQSYGANASTIGRFTLRQASSDFSLTRIPLVIESTGAATFSSSVTGARFDPTSSSASGTGMYLAGTNKLGFSTNGVERFVQTNSSLSINNINPLGYPLEIFGTTVNTRLYIAGTTNPVVAQFANNGGTWYFGMDDSNGTNYTGISYARFIYSSLDIPFIFGTNSIERLKIHGSGGLKFKPQSAPTAEEGTVYYDSSTKKLKVYNGTSWIDLH